MTKKMRPIQEAAYEALVHFGQQGDENVTKAFCKLLLDSEDLVREWAINGFARYAKGNAKACANLLEKL